MEACLLHVHFYHIASQVFPLGKLLYSDISFMFQMQVKELQRKPLLCESSTTLTMHDLYFEFALSLVEKEGGEDDNLPIGVGGDNQESTNCSRCY